MKLYSLLFLILYSLFPSQTFNEIDKRIKDSPRLISEGKKDEFVQVMNDVIRTSHKIGYPYGIASGYYGKAYVSYIKRDFSNSINFAKISEREKLGTEHSKLKTDNYHLLAQNYAEQGMNEEAIRYYRKMITSSKTIPDKSKAIYNENIAYNDIASLYQNDKKSDSSYYYMLKIYNNLHDYNARDEKLDILLAKATTAVALTNKAKGKKDSADYYLKQSVKQLPEKFEENSKVPYLFKHLTPVYAVQGELKKAKKYADLYTEYSEKTEILGEIKNAYKLNAEVSEKTDSSKEAYKYLKQYVTLNDSINKIDKKNTHKTFEKSLQQKNKQIKKQTAYSRYLLLLIILIVSALIFSGYIFKKHLKKKNKEKNNILTEKESEITDLESRINIAFEEVIALAKSNSPIFLTRFQEVYPDFCNKLIKIYPEIQNSELTFCAYIRLNFSTKDIASSTFVTPKTIQMRKYRLRKKLNIPSDKDIYIWMNNL